MTVPSETIWPLDPHTSAKHEILKLYLQRWFPILSSSHDRIIYIDGFCGPGRYKGGEPGSPIIVLDLAENHIKPLTGDVFFRFIDERADRIEHLESELAKRSSPTNFDIRAIHGRFDEKLRSILDGIDHKKFDVDPTFIFIDPFGFSGVPYTLIKRALEKPKREVLITFMIDAMNRFLDHPTEQIPEHIVEAFGTRNCLSIDRNSPHRIMLLRDIYQSQLEKAAKFVRYFEMRDRTDRVEYLLFFATNHSLGHIKMKEAMWAVDPDGEFRFSDATNPSQQVLFGSNTSSLLWPVLRRVFLGREVLTDDVQMFVEDKTAFLAKHMKAALREHENPELPAPEQIQVRDLKADGKRRRKESFPKGVYVTFPS